MMVKSTLKLGGTLSGSPGVPVGCVPAMRQRQAEGAAGLHVRLLEAGRLDDVRAALRQRQGDQGVAVAALAVVVALDQRCRRARSRNRNGSRSPEVVSMLIDTLSSALASKL